MESQKHTEVIASETKQLLAAAQINWEVKKETIFESTFEALMAEEERKSRIIPLNFIKIGIAASLLIIIGLSFTLMFYSKTITNPAGNHFTAQLPDNSRVEMNAASSIKYYPYRWYFSRKLKFEGEAFFSVEKGKKFTVTSNLGETTVLGTSFNIYSRDNDYKVYCETGKVSVKNYSGKEVILTPNQMVRLSKGKLTHEQTVSPENILSWRNNYFNFSAAPIQQVIKEIERQYNITVNATGIGNEIISVSFKKEPDVEKVLAMVCKPLGFDYIKQSENKFIIQASSVK